MFCPKDLMGHHKTHHRGDRYEPLKRLALVQIHPPRNPNKPLTPFFISDILNPRGKGDAGSDDPRGGLGFVRPWADSPPPRSTSPSDLEDDEDEEISVDDEPQHKVPAKKEASPLDALLQMTSKTFEGLETQRSDSDDTSKRDQLSLFSKNTPAKKRRKSRTAFTNQQIYELEKRFLYQKYLTPADRDEIAASLGLSNAQVITWFQNRRAKLKRDLEELKADVTAAKIQSGPNSPSSIDINSPDLDVEPMDEEHFKRPDIKKLCLEGAIKTLSSISTSESPPETPVSSPGSSMCPDSPVSVMSPQMSSTPVPKPSPPPATS